MEYVVPGSDDVLCVLVLLLLLPLGPNEGEAHGWFERPEAVLSPCPWAFFITHRSNGRGTTEQRVVQGPCPGLLYHSTEQRKGNNRTDEGV